MGTLDDRFRIGQGGAYEFDKDTNISIDQSLRAAVRFRPIDVTLDTTHTVEDAILCLLQGTTAQQVKVLTMS